MQVQQRYGSDKLKDPAPGGGGQQSSENKNLGALGAAPRVWLLSAPAPARGKGPGRGAQSTNM
jgi:hypothetical protein